jgi:hypothetical protein
LTFSVYRETDFPTSREQVAADLIAAKHGAARPAQILLRFPVVIITERSWTRHGFQAITKLGGRDPTASEKRVQVHRA